jgi:Protein of unknown function (DUF3616)
VLRTAPQVGPFFGKDLNETDGLNVEGIAVAGGRLFAGLRAPVLKRKAFVWSVSVDDLFSRDPLLPRPEVRVIPLQLGKKAGIRDLAPLGVGRFLVLTGPAQEQKKVPYGLSVVDIASPRSPRFLATLGSVEEDGMRGKAEEIVVLHAAADELHVIVLFDSLPNGAPREYRIPLRSSTARRRLTRFTQLNPPRTTASATTPHFPGSPWQNGFAERLTGLRFRGSRGASGADCDECTAKSPLIAIKCAGSGCRACSRRDA